MQARVEPVTAERLLETTDWAATPVGPRASWPAGLAAVVETIVRAPIPMAVACGPSLTLVYNDAYAMLIRSKHPEAFGCPAAQVMAESWSRPGHGDVVERVYATGEPFYEAETLLPVRRQGAHGPVEQVHFSRAYTAVRGDDGSVLGVLTVITETTEVARALAGLAELAVRLSSALTVDDVARETLRHGVEDMRADHVRLVLAEGRACRMARHSGLDSHDESAERLPPVWVTLSPDDALPSVEVTRTGRPLWLGPADLARFTALPDEPAWTGEVTAVAAVPLRVGTVRGALSLGWEAPHEFGPSERAALTTVGNLVGQALSRAQRFDEQRGLAEMLQRSMLPAELPHVPGLSIGARYEPSGPGTSAGGDFYDAFMLPDGRLVFAIGDVVGHGALAAAVMGQVRAALRVVAFQEPDPARILAGLDPFVADLGAETFVTALVGLLDLPARRLTLVTAGHPPPLLRSSGPAGDAAIRCSYPRLPAAPPLGIAAERVASTLSLAPGDLLLMFTDGLVEEAAQSIDVGLEDLKALVLAHHDADPRTLCSVVVDRMGTGNDDIAVVAVSLDDVQRRTATLDIAADSRAPGTARRWAATTLGAWGLDDDLTGVAELAISELVTNALLHARSGSRLELDLDDRRLLVLVRDSGLTAEVSVQAADPAAVRGRGLALIEALVDAWGSERTSRGTTVWFELARPAPPPLSGG